MRLVMLVLHSACWKQPNLKSGVTHLISRHQHKNRWHTLLNICFLRHPRPGLRYLVAICRDHERPFQHYQHKLARLDRSSSGRGPHATTAEVECIKGLCDKEW